MKPVPAGGGDHPFERVVDHLIKTRANHAPVGRPAPRIAAERRFTLGRRVEAEQGLFENALVAEKAHFAAFFTIASSLAISAQSSSKLGKLSSRSRRTGKGPVFSSANAKR